MNCREVREAYTDLLEGWLGEADETRIHEHLAACPACRRFDRAYHLGVAALRELPCPRLSRAFTARVLHAVRARSVGDYPSLASGFAGAALVVALVGSFAFDVRARVHLEPVSSAHSPDTSLAMAPPDHPVGVITTRLGDLTFGAPFWDPMATGQASDADRSVRAPFEVLATWTGR
jgi:hypothetical protein